MVLFFVIDTSGSMAGSKIGAVNTAIEEVIPAIREVSDDNADAQIKIAALEFSNGARWLTPNGPVPADQFSWNFIEALGVTDMGEAFKELNKKLSTKAFMQEATGSFAPAIILLSDGDPTDDWEHALNDLKQNNWFKVAVKVAIAVGDDANKDILMAFTGGKGKEAPVIEVHNAAMLKKMIKFVSVRASQVASKSSNVGAGGTQTEGGDETKQAEVTQALREFEEENTVEAVAAPDNSAAADGGEDW
jgi:uncharacterized protein YegL